MTTILKLMSGQRLLYRSLTDTTETQSVEIGGATEGDVTPAGEKFCELLRQMSSEAGRDRRSRRDAENHEQVMISTPYGAHDAGAFGFLPRSRTAPPQQAL